MLEFSMTTSGSLGYPLLISQIIEEALVDISDTPFIVTYISRHLLLGTCIYHHLDICKVDEAWTYFEDINASPRGMDLPPPVDDSDEDTIIHPVYYHAFDEVEDVEDDLEEDLNDKADLKSLNTGRINIQHDQDSDSRKQDWQPFANGENSRLGEIGFALQIHKYNQPHFKPTFPFIFVP
ncbi:hypothetical protein Lal_00021317 [Lupinus albus]|nr:hypothetical protein Lal_00021317 [Lupinus albus]